MADPSLPLSTLEYEEWGNPAIEEQYRYMLSYSPYDNVSAQAYPPVFVIAGWHEQPGRRARARQVARAAARHQNQVGTANAHCGRAPPAARVQAAGELGWFLDGAAANGKEAHQPWLEWAIVEPSRE